MSWKLTAALGLTLFATLAPAATLLDQPVAFFDSRASSTTDGTTGFQTWDRISLANSGQVQRISWVGGFLDTTTLANNPVVADADSWEIQIASDNGNEPGNVFSTTSVPFLSVMSTLLGNGTIINQPVAFYRYTLDLPAAISLSSGTTYWLSIMSRDTATMPIFAWLSGSGGDGVAKQYYSPTGNLQGTYTDRALTLEGDLDNAGVPEPATNALLAAGLVAIAALRKRR